MAMSKNAAIVHADRLNSLREEREYIKRHVNEVNMLGWPDVEVRNVLRDVDRQIVNAVAKQRYHY